MRDAFFGPTNRCLVIPAKNGRRPLCSSGGGGGGGGHAKKSAPAITWPSGVLLFGLAGGEWCSYITSAAVARATAPNVVSKNMRPVGGHHFISFKPALIAVSPHVRPHVRPPLIRVRPLVYVFAHFRFTWVPLKNIQNHRQVSRRVYIRLPLTAVVPSHDGQTRSNPSDPTRDVHGRNRHVRRWNRHRFRLGHRRRRCHPPRDLTPVRVI